MQNIFPYAFGLLGLLILWLLYYLFTRKANPLLLAMGLDGLASTSKMQFFAWTVVVLFSYVAIIAARYWAKKLEFSLDIPTNLLIAMGLSITTVISAKAIRQSSSSATNSTLGGNSIPGNSIPGKPNRWGYLLTEDDGTPSLSKAQMLAWTAVSIVLYIMNVQVFISDTLAGVEKKGLPDIDATLMVLMGLSLGAYLGKKMLTTGSPAISKVDPPVGLPGAKVTISGASFGDMANLQGIALDGQPVAYAEWSDTAITFVVPEGLQNGVRTPNKQCSLTVTNSVGQASNQYPFTVVEPCIEGLMPSSAAPGTVVRILGQHFGAKPDTAQVILGDMIIQPEEWNEFTVTFKVPDSGNGVKWTTNSPISVAIRIYGKPTNSVPFIVLPSE